MADRFEKLAARLATLRAIRDELSDFGHGSLLSGIAFEKFEAVRKAIEIEVVATFAEVTVNPERCYVVLCGGVAFRYESVSGIESWLTSRGWNPTDAEVYARDVSGLEPGMIVNEEDDLDGFSILVADLAWLK